MAQENKWKARFEKERLIRKEAEKILEEKSLELYNLNQTLQFQKIELETIFNTSIDGIAIVDLDTNFILFNKAFQIMSGYSKEELLKKSFLELTLENNQNKAKSALNDVLKNGSLDNFEKKCLLNDGKIITVNMSVSLMPDKNSFLISTKDITEIKNKEEEIKNYLNLIDKNIISSTTDLKGIITNVSKAFSNISGYSKEELLGENHRIIKHPDMPKSIFKDIWSTISKNKTWEGEIKNLKKDGNFYWVHASISPVFNDAGIKIGYTAIRQDITDKKLIEEISITDGLTNIYNRRHFKEMLPKIINSSKKDNELVSFLILDIDHFKQYNDTYGHHMGDDVLIQIAKTLKDSLTQADAYCFRLGGEEFGVIFKTTSKEKALEFANTIRHNIENLHIEHQGNSASEYVTASMGLVSLNANEIDNYNEMYKKSDDLLYVSKKAGRNRVSV